MKILSIDFDYFLKISDTFSALWLPDGGAEFSDNDLCDFVWTSCYAGAEAAGLSFEENVTVNMDSLNKVSDFLRTQRKSTIFYAADSHRWLWQCAREVCGYKSQKAEVVNIDFHHDTFISDSTEIHCGNWFRHLIDDGVAKKAYWVRCCDSNMDQIHSQLCEMTLDEALRGQYDLVYICRSGWWTPPHLDSVFIEKMLAPLFRHNRNTYCEEIIKTSRYTDLFRDSVEEQKNMRKKLAAWLNKGGV